MKRNAVEAYALPSSDVESSFPAPASYPHHLAFDGTNLISLDAVLDRIYIHAGVSSPTTSYFSTPGSKPSGIFFDGTNLLSTDSSSRRLYVHDGVSSTILTSYATGLINLTGVTMANGQILLSRNAAPSNIYSFDTGTTTATLLRSETLNPRGFFFDGTNLIMSDYSNDRYVVFDGITSTVLAYVDAPAGGTSNIRGCTMAGANFISCDSTTNQIYIHEAG